MPLSLGGIFGGPDFSKQAMDHSRAREAYRQARRRGDKASMAIHEKKMERAVQEIIAQGGSRWCWAVFPFGAEAAAIKAGEKTPSMRAAEHWLRQNGFWPIQN